LIQLEKVEEKAKSTAQTATTAKVEATTNTKTETQIKATANAKVAETIGKHKLKNLLTKNSRKKRKANGKKKRAKRKCVSWKKSF